MVAFHDSSWEKQKKMVLLNIVALMQMTYVFGQAMKRRKKGRILNVASIAGLVPDLICLLIMQRNPLYYLLVNLLHMN